MMKRIGILTYHRAINYGALMQTYALQKALQSKGADVRVIDYCSPHIDWSYRLTWGLNKKHVKGWMNWLRGIPYTIRKKRRFRKYEKKVLNMTSNAYSDKNIAECECEFDKIITGSDQVWNLNINGNDTAYLLDFVKNPEKKYSYAVSIGAYQFEDEYAKMLHDFSELSLRETSAAQYIEQLTGKSCRTNIDPTLLLTGDDWRKEVGRTRLMKKPYIFIYSVHPQNHLIQVAKELANKTGYEIIYLHNRVQTQLMKIPDVKVLFDCTPAQFLGYIEGAQCVLTNSFHGTVFSILFHKQFFSELCTVGGFNNRVFELLYSLGLERRYLENNVELGAWIDVEEKIDWDDVEQRLAEYRQSSLQYIEELAKR